MRRRSLPAVTTATAAVVSLALAAPAAAAPDPGRALGREGQVGNGAERNDTAATQAPTRPARPAKARPTELAYPRQTVLTEPAVDSADASIRLGLTPYHELAPRLNALQAESERVSVEVIGQSRQGRDLYLVTVTAPETPGEAQLQEQIRRRIEEDPEAAAGDRSLLSRYKAPFLVNGNIHGNEWEGTDGILEVVEELARSTDPAVTAMLERTRVHAVVSVNPDGRVAGTRANAAGFDMNRDYITASQPEVVATRQALIDIQPLVFLDQHGYVGGTLIEPGTAPHGQNYEYDLYIKHALPNAEAMEAALEAAYTGRRIPDARPGEIDPVIPFRDWEAGDWDDWPPVFTPMYSIFHGAVGHTIEFPLRVNGSNYTTLPVQELQRRARVNTDVVAETIRASLAYLDTHRAELIADQVEVFRRGLAGEPDRELPVGSVPGWGTDDQGYTTEFPRAYVIPTGAGQRSDAAAARLVDFLVANDVRVTRAQKAVTLGGTTYPAGSHVVDMHQAKRGLANVILEAGRDISSRVPRMYDISGWSHSLLWGATVDAVRTGDLGVVGKDVAVAAPTGGVTAPAGSALALTLSDPKDVQALNALLDRGIAASMTADGTVVMPASARAAAAEVASAYGVRISAAPAGAAGVPLEDVTVAAAAAADELEVLRDLGFEVRPVSTAILDNGFDWTGVDVLYVGSGLVHTTYTVGTRTVPGLSAAAQADLEEFLSSGGVVTRGVTGELFNRQADLLDVEATVGRSDANGVVSVTNSGGPIASGALPHSFVYAPLWFTAGTGVVVEQTYGPSDVLVAGHWLPDAGAAGGAASVVRGEDPSGASVVMFGTEPMFRDHPKGLYSQVARSLFFTTATAGAAVSAP